MRGRRSRRFFTGGRLFGFGLFLENTDGIKALLADLVYRLLIAAYHMLSRREPYRELGATYLDERNKTKVVNRMARCIEKLGYCVTIEPATSTIL